MGKEILKIMYLVICSYSGNKKIAVNLIILFSFFINLIGNKLNVAEFMNWLDYDNKKFVYYLFGNFR